MKTLCRAYWNQDMHGRPIGTINYGKPHVPVTGKDGDTVRYSCLFCGKWMDENEVA